MHLGMLMSYITEKQPAENMELYTIIMKVHIH